MSIHEVLIPTRTILKYDNPMTNKIWQCGEINSQDFLEATPEFIEENQGSQNHYAVYSDFLQNGYRSVTNPYVLYDYHVARIAWLIANPDPEPIMLMTGVMPTSSKSQYLKITDGNHRTIARHYSNPVGSISATIVHHGNISNHPIHETISRLNDPTINT